MVENGNKAKGLILTILLVILLIVTITQVILLNTSQQFTSIGYQDPNVTTTLVRGTIYDRNGKVLAIQAPEYGFQIAEIQNVQQVSAILCDSTNYSSFEIAALLDNGVTFIPVKGIPTESDVEYYQKILEINGIDQEVEFVIREKRKYPTGVLGEILGNAVSPYKGTGGIEKIYNEDLAAVPTIDQKSVYGSTLVLTVDLDLQMALETAIPSNSEVTAILFSTNNEILALWGNLDEEVIKSIVYSISSNTETILNDTTLSDRYWEASTPMGSYNLFIEGKNKETIWNSLRNILVSAGKI